MVDKITDAEYAALVDEITEWFTDSVLDTMHERIEKACDRANLRYELDRDDDERLEIYVNWGLKFNMGMAKQKWRKARRKKKCASSK